MCSRSPTTARAMTMTRSWSCCMEAAPMVKNGSTLTVKGGSVTWPQLALSLCSQLHLSRKMTMVVQLGTNLSKMIVVLMMTAPMTSLPSRNQLLLLPLWLNTRRNWLEERPPTFSLVGSAKDHKWPHTCNWPNLTMLSVESLFTMATLSHLPFTLPKKTQLWRRPRNLLTTRAKIWDSWSVTEKTTQSSLPAQRRKPITKFLMFLRSMTPSRLITLNQRLVISTPRLSSPWWLISSTARCQTNKERTTEKPFGFSSWSQPFLEP